MLNFQKIKVQVQQKEECEMVNVPYKRFVSNIMYYMVNTRPDIHVIVEIIAQFFNNRGLSHWQVVKHI